MASWISSPFPRTIRTGEFFDDEVESIRFFDIETQRTVGKATKMSIVPNVENKTFLESRLAAELPPQGNTTLDGHSIHGGGKA